MAVDPRVDLHAVAILAGIDVQILVHLVAVVDHTKIDLFGVARIDLHGAVVGIDANLGAAGDG